MTTLRDPARMLEYAFELAESGRGFVEPNPRVGAVVCENSRIVGRGYHAEYGGRHAEIVALDEAAHAGRTPDVMVVTLEPCASAGKTPPCVEAIIKSGIRTVYVGATDPNLANAGRGFAKLTDHGIGVHYLKHDIRFREQNRPFTRALLRTRPWIIVKWAMTLDGRTSLANGDSKWVTGEKSRDWVHRMRGRCEGVCVGVSTVLRDDPLLTCRNHLLLRNPPARIIFDSRLRTPPNATVIVNRDAPTWILTLPIATLPPSAAERRRSLELAGAHVIEVEGDHQFSPPRVDVNLAMELLYKLGIRRLFVESGPKLLGTLRAAKLIDQAIAMIAPKLTGAPSAPQGVIGAPEAASMSEADVLEEVYGIRIADDIVVGGFLNLQSAP
ncbi:MAG: bifunctional diaminohydroxyphosphoribosylaminopyrimidine deaminase/5-amino-6-(5-phosphoribosylamino)uracil reductase RibD [Planctomycetota bacterium]